MAASTTYTPRPPRTPPPNSSAPVGLGLGDSPAIRTDHDYDIHHGINDSPSKPPDSGRTDSAASSMLSPAFSSASPASSHNGSLYTPLTASTTDGTFPLNNEPIRNPFNFTTTQYVAGRGRRDSNTNNDAVGKRRGHKYRHSSVHASAMDSIIQPPSLRTPLSLPASLPIPTRKEAWRSLTRVQSMRLAWCLAHFLIAGYVQYLGSGSLAMTALSRLLLFDAAGATVCVVVDVMANFEVWKRSSIKHPFGLERADVLAGFGMAVFIAFMGLDVISHGIEHSLENVGSHQPHTEHAHTRVKAASVHIASLLSITSTLISALVLGNHKQIGKAVAFSTNSIFLQGLAGWSSILSNPSHVLTLTSSILLLILPVLSAQTYTLFDLAFSFLIAVAMLAFGLRLGTSLASMLLMSYPRSSRNRDAVRDVIVDIETQTGVSGVEEARLWQVHYGLCIANLKLRYRIGSDLVRIRQRVESLIRQRLGGRWEVSLQMALERD